MRISCNHTILNLPIAWLIVLVFVDCHPVAQHHSEKIALDYSQIDEEGLRQGEASVDYEFCIPANDPAFEHVLKIEPTANVFKSSKGRSGCTKEEWLVIVNTHHEHWKEKLYAIASLSFVRKISETYYE